MWFAFLPFSDYAFLLMPFSSLIWPRSPLDPPLGLCSETRNALLSLKLHLPFLKWFCRFLLNRQGSLCTCWPNSKQDLWILSRIFMLSIPPWNFCWFHLVNKAAGWSLAFPDPAKRLCGHNANVIMQRLMNRTSIGEMGLPNPPLLF